MALTVRRIQKLTAAGRYGDGGGLYLQITPTGGRSWLFRYQVRDRERAMGLGPERDFGLEEARSRARKARQQLRDGIDPIDAQKAERDARALEAARNLSFKEAAQRYFDGHERKWSNATHRKQFMASLQEYAFPVIGKIPVGMIDTALVLKVLQPIWQDKAVTANRVRNRIESVLGWAMASGFRTGDNPARWRGHLREVLPPHGKIAKVEHHKALPYGEMPAFMASLAMRKRIDCRALQFLILTAARTGEVINAKWSEIDFDTKVWTIPPERIKGRREHRVPLTDQVITILKSLPTEAGYIFIGTKKGSRIGKMAMATALGAINKEVTVHGFRSTFRDWAGETTAFPSDICEAALAHSLGSKTQQAYQRGDLLEKRRQLMNAWATYCSTPRPAKQPAKVISMRKRK